MLRTFPYLSRLLSKLFYEIMPAAVASAIGGILFNHYARQPPTPPAVTIAAPASPELVQMIRDDHAFLVSYLKQSAETHQQADLTAEQSARRAKAAEQAAALAVREVKAAETRAAAVRTPAMTPHVAQMPERKFAARPPAEYLGKPVTAEPTLSRQVAGLAATPNIAAPTVATQLQPAAMQEPPAEHSDENMIVATLHNVTATVQRIPSWIVHSTVHWLSDDAPPRPPASLPGTNFAKAAM